MSITREIIDLVKQAASLRWDRDPTAALHLLQSAYENTSYTPDEQASLLVGIGETYKHLRKFEEAKESFLKAVDLNPDNHYARCALGNMFLRAGKIDQAEEQFSAVLATRPHDRFALTGVEWVKEARHSQSIIQHPETRATHSPAQLVTHPGESGLTIVKPIENIAKPFNQIDALKVKIADNPRQIGPRFQLAAIFAQQGMTMDAADQLWTIREIAPLDYPAKEKLQKLGLPLDRSANKASCPVVKKIPILEAKPVIEAPSTAIATQDPVTETSIATSVVPLTIVPPSPANSLPIKEDITIDVYEITVKLGKTAVAELEVQMPRDWQPGQPVSDLAKIFVRTTLPVIWEDSPDNLPDIQSNSSLKKAAGPHKNRVKAL